MSAPVPRVHHSAICTRNWDASVRFWRDGLGLQPLMENTFDGAWSELFGATGDKLHSVFLGDPGQPDGGIVEIVEFPTGIADATPIVGPAVGFFLLSFYVDVDATLARLADMGLGGEARRIVVAGGGGAPTLMAVVRDPDGVIVELIGVGQG